MTKETRTLRGLFPDPKPPRRKNFIKENVRSLRRMEQMFHANNASANDLKLPILRHKISHRRESVGDNEFDKLNEGLKNLSTEEAISIGIEKLMKKKSSADNEKRERSAPVFLNKQIALKKCTKPPINGLLNRKSQVYQCRINSKSENKQKSKAHSIGDISFDNQTLSTENGANIKCKSQGVQTLDTNDMSNLYSEGIIRYSSGKSKEFNSHTKDVSNGSLDPVNSPIKHNTEDFCGDNVDDTKLNKESISMASKLALQLGNAPPSNYKIGVVPKYIKERKEALKREQAAKAAAKYSDCPDGHIPLPDNERKETLSMLKKNYQEFVNELNMLPIRTDTLRSQKRKMEIEKQLTKLEEAIKVFSRPKVFVKIDS
ncbi:uncharacterized protein LOC131671192 [Phymastichus coffea]|uniref:uncharacterized protein LOC131671192 n=1 Tax=Phymastichus coffea TaxID=108790 RepID=UPI00273B2573|nr:uncharacterized protein LOC131671192 [Phymastichus coffea]XP_058803426.1 uncharacterized protein LOC131671192 [Phymastichus coffea]